MESPRWNFDKIESSKMRRVSMALACLILILSFQNCGKVAYVNPEGETASASTTPNGSEDAPDGSSNNSPNTPSSPTTGSGPNTLPTPGPVATPTPGPNATPTPGPVATPTPGPAATPTPGPIATPTPGPAATPTPGPIATPTPGPTATPMPSPTPTSPAAKTVVHASNLSQTTVIPGKTFNITYSFSNLTKTAVDEMIFVHFVNSSGAIVFQDTHWPALPTSQWSTGSLSENRTVAVPSSAASGTYKILVGIYNADTGVRESLSPGSGVIDDGQNRYQVGTLNIQLNLAWNPGFENAWDSWEGWENASLVTGGAQTVGYSMRAGTGQGGIAQDLRSRVKDGATYQLRAYGKIDSSTEKAWIAYKFLNASDQVIGTDGVAITTTSFNQYGIDFVVPAGAVKVWVMLWKDAGSSYAYIDDVTVVEIAPPP